MVCAEVLSTLIENDSGEPEYFFSQLVDVTARKRAESEREDAARLLAQRAAEQEAVAALGQRALRSSEPSNMIAEATAVAAKILGVDLAGVFEFAADRGDLRLRAGHGFGEGQEVAMSARPECHAGYALRSSQPVVVEDLESDPRFEPAEALSERGAVSGMSVPVDDASTPSECSASTRRSAGPSPPTTRPS